MELFVPGRICLFGEHSDWAGGYRRQNSLIEKGYTIISGTNQGLYARVSSHPNRLRMHASLPGGEKKHGDFSMDPEALLSEARKGGFFSYGAGVAYQVLMNWHVGGIEIDNYRTDLPLKKGLSSSAAVCVLVARAFNRLYDLRLTVRGEMDLAYRGEITTPSRCGRMDQGCAYGSTPVVMTFDGELVEVNQLRVGGPFHFLVVDLKGKKDTVKILADLNQSYPFARSDRDREIQDYLGPVNKRIVKQAAEALRAGRQRELGSLMNEAQELFDRYAGPASPDQLAAPRLHELLAYPGIQGLIWGGKGVGSQGDGTAQLLCRGPREREKAASLVEKELGMEGLPLDITPAEEPRRVLIPAAGFGSELFPASKVAQKELFPVVDGEGVAKPALLVNLEQADQCGLEEAVIVVRPEEEQTLKRFFRRSLAPKRLHYVPEALRNYDREVLRLGRSVKLVVQNEPLGFGHAVYCAKDHLKGEPFVLFLGDYLYKGTEERSCVGQMLDIYAQMQRTVIGLKRITEDQVDSMGVVSGTWLKQGELLEIGEVVEKPGVKYARNKLRIEGLAEGEYLGLFGTYVLQNNIFKYLGRMIEEGLDVAGKFELTEALELLRREDGCLGFMVQGKSYDIASPEGYIEALQAFRKAWTQ